MSSFERSFYRLAGAGALLASLAACSSPPERFYTLDTVDPATVHTEPNNPSFLIQLVAVDVPEQVERSQFVVQKSATQVDVVERERWISLPSEEICHALSSALATRLDTIDVANSASPPAIPVYRVSVNVERFESWPGKRASIDAVWSVRSLASQAVMTCHSDVSVEIGPGYDALVAGHRQAVGQLATQIASVVQAIAGTTQQAKNAIAWNCPRIS
ncbi:membrane integrity-associated transporter subunit PqiC [Paraburkholderia sp. EG287A]|uniref:PqiC family protein n=1 Tax=unclassified Paraburkholderia TaxID=2615204 RepID=UPI0034D36D2E